MRSFLVLFTAILLAGSSATATAAESTVSGAEAQPFALDMLASRPDNYVRAITFSPGGDEAYWPVIDTTDKYKRWIVHSRIENGVWTEPQIASFSNKDFYDDVPCVSPSGEKIFFISGRPVEEGGKVEKERIWHMSLNGENWSDPVPLPESINTEFTIHQQVSLDKDDNLYFGGEGAGGHGSLDICYSEFRDGKYQEPVNLGPVINCEEGDYAPCVSPDGSYLIFTRNIDEGWTLMISFRDRVGSWTVPTDLRGIVDGFDGMNLSGSCLTPDSKHLIFFGERDDGDNAPYWIDTSFIEDGRIKALKSG